MTSRRETAKPRRQPIFPLIPAPLVGSAGSRPGGPKPPQPVGQPRREATRPPPRQTGRRGTAVRLEGVYVISVASRILEMHPQTLRKYERLGLVSPSRTEGMLRLYSEGDIARLRMIKELVETQRMNLAGVEMALGVINRLLEMRQLVYQLLDAEDEARARIHQEMEGMMRLLGFPLPLNPEE